MNRQMCHCIMPSLLALRERPCWLHVAGLRGLGGFSAEEWPRWLSSAVEQRYRRHVLKCCVDWFNSALSWIRVLYGCPRD